MPTTAKKQFQDMVDKIVSTHRPDVRVSRMYGIAVIVTRGRAFAGLDGEALAVRLDAPTRERALRLKGAKAFEPANGNSMPEWVSVPFEQVSHWRGLMQDALHYINTGA